jgi:hypothetical protein
MNKDVVMDQINRVNAELNVLRRMLENIDRHDVTPKIGQINEGEGTLKDFRVPDRPTRRHPSGGAWATLRANSRAFD